MISVLKFIKNTLLFPIIIGIVIILISFGSQSKDIKLAAKTNSNLRVGANQTNSYLPLLHDKNIGIVANQTSVIFKDKDSVFYVNANTNKKRLDKTTNPYTHLVDSLLSLNVKVKKVFAPEHGFRGQANAGEVIKDGIDIITGLPIISLYGSNKKPSADELKEIDLIIFDIQDVGARFYTYISTLHYVMEACAEQNIPVILLDRPNPNGHYVDGPVLEPEFKSFVGMHPIPVVHGMTIGEYALMINGEGWLKNGVQCDLKVIPVKNYTHSTPYSLPIKPSPNLPNDKAINLYPSLCFFEGTNISVGRGTDMQFQVIGNPYLKNYLFCFTPKANNGAKYPKFEGTVCFGKDLREAKHLEELNLSWLIEFYTHYKKVHGDTDFFNSFFSKLAGTKKLQQQIESGMTAPQIKKTWEEDLETFKRIRKKYLIYP